MNSKSIEQATISGNLTIAPPKICDPLPIELESPTINSNLLIKLEQAAISDDLTQEYIHFLRVYKENSNP